MEPPSGLAKADAQHGPAGPEDPADLGEVGGHDGGGVVRASECVEAALVEDEVELAIGEAHAGRIHDPPLQPGAMSVPGGHLLDDDNGGVDVHNMPVAVIVHFLRQQAVPITRVQDPGRVVACGGRGQKPANFAVTLQPLERCWLLHVVVIPMPRAAVEARLPLHLAEARSAGGVGHAAHGRWDPRPERREHKAAGADREH
eukprot:CAMPEP_0176086064 /NCGR_PEP_ID=MMETSP0120_2-20121206/43079_1 /TAXON_ID=160619 /ORGANISM="Kryptoperidinium foliaceum, Strain CCMP 1326" /LENGTH=200 /DNA_ID=CAMNT_0017419891 /DNA_START=141 /DNA_END=740 /DNA_ORIENTATION=+